MREAKKLTINPETLKNYSFLFDAGYIDLDKNRKLL
jgi:hypothetical protein